MTGAVDVLSSHDIIAHINVDNSLVIWACLIYLKNFVFKLVIVVL